MKFVYLNILGVCLFAAQAATAQTTQKVIYPDGTVRIETVKAKKVRHLPTAQTAVNPAPARDASQAGVTVDTRSCCDGGPTDPSGKCKGCKEGSYLEPDLDTINPNEQTTTKDIRPKQSGEIEQIDEVLEFYTVCKEFDVRLPIPVCKRVQSETCLFTMQTYRSRCCEFAVCIPCEQVTKVSSKCELADQDVRVRVCVRREKVNGSDVVDVYVLDVPGMPDRWMLFLATPINLVTDKLSIQI